MSQGFGENLYLIDLSYLNTPAEVVYDLSSILDNNLAKNQRVKLKLGKVDFNKSQLLSLKSLIESINSTLAIIEGESDCTRKSAISIGLVYQNSVDKVQDIMFFNNSNTQTEKNYSEVSPDLFPEVSPVRNEQKFENEEQQINTENETSNQENQAENIFSEPDNSSSDGKNFEIQPQKFETTEENLQFEDNSQEWLQSEQKVENNENKSDIQDNVIAVNENFNQDTVLEKQNLIAKVNSLFGEENISDNIGNNENSENNNIPEENKTEDITPGIQTLSDIPLDIPSDKTIQEELDVIYSAERKLDDLFEATGLKEEKFQSLKDSPKAEEKEYTQYDFELEAFPTKYLKQTICAGQYISFDGNLVIIGDCHEGSEISAAGDITVWGDLSGSAHAGKNGNEKCKIRALRMNASLLRISNCYVKRPSVLNNSSKVDTIPEEAVISNGEIAVYRIYK